MATLNDYQRKQLLVEVFKRNEAPKPDDWTRLSNAGLVGNWREGRLSDQEHTHNSGFSVGLVQLDFASTNEAAGDVVKAITSRLTEHKLLAGEELNKALKGFHANHLKNSATKDSKEEGTDQKSQDQTNFKLIVKYGDLINWYLRNDPEVNAALQRATLKQLEKTFEAADTTFNHIEASLNAKGKTSYLLTNAPDLMKTVFADTQNQLPVALKSTKKWLIAHPEATWDDYLAYAGDDNKVRAHGRARLNAIKVLYDQTQTGELVLDGRAPLLQAGRIGRPHNMVALGGSGDKNLDGVPDVLQLAGQSATKGRNAHAALESGDVMDSPHFPAAWAYKNQSVEESVTFFPSLAHIHANKAAMTKQITDMYEKDQTVILNRFNTVAISNILHGHITPMQINLTSRDAMHGLPSPAIEFS